MARAARPRQAADGGAPGAVAGPAGVAGSCQSREAAISAPDAPTPSVTTPLAMNPWMTLALLAGLTALILFLAWRRRGQELQRELQACAQRESALRQQQALANAEHRVQQETLFNSMSEGVLLVDANSHIQWINRSLQAMFGIHRDLRGLTVLEAFRLREIDELLRRLQTERTVTGHEMELPGLEERWFQVNAAALVDPEGRPRGAILVFHDVSRLKQLENTRQEFVANVSHELRTPLSLIKGYVETLLEGAKNDPDLCSRFLQTIEKHTDRLTFLIEDILTISKLEGGQIVLNQHPIELRPEIGRVLDDLRSLAAERTIQIENVVPEGLIALGDADRLNQVFFNLVENAIKYGRKGGKVQIGAKPHPGDRLEVWVRDDGPGIPEDAQPRVFERFYRVDRARSRESGGTGLGLSIVKHIVQAHGGEVWLESQLGQGTTFFFTLPRK